MIKIGCYNNLTVNRIISFGAYLTDGSEEVLLPNKQIPRGTAEGDKLRVFVYTDSEDRPIATSRQPFGVVGDFVLLEVKETTRFGAFLEWGLEKDLFVPFKEQGENRMRQGKKYVVKICYDPVSNRLLGSMRYRRHAKLQADKGMWPGLEVNMLVLEEQENAYLVLLNNSHLGLLYKRDLIRKVKVGEKCPAWVSKIRQDGRLDVSIKQPGFAGACNEKPGFIAKLKNANGFLPYNGKCSPEEIKKEFGMSKKTFKQLIGNLYKERKILITDSGIELVKE